MSPENINRNFNLRKKKPDQDSETNALIARLLLHDTSGLPQILTYIESNKNRGSKFLNSMLASLPIKKDTLRIAISGPPGVGKSTLIDKLGMKFINKGFSVAVLAIDPSSEVHQGSILGDKTRMIELARSSKAFIRPSANALEIGGVRNSTYDSIRICEAGGFDIIIVETVGVGQSELDAAQITDLFVLMLSPAGGDELQGVKKGIVEMADLIVVNKSDGEFKNIAKQTALEYESASHYSSQEHKILGKVIVSEASALNNVGIDTLENNILQVLEQPEFQNKKLLKRHTQESQQFVNQAKEIMLHLINKNADFQSKTDELNSSIKNSSSSIYSALNQMMDFLRTQFNL